DGRRTGKSGFGIGGLGFGSCAALAELCGVRIGRGARAEDPADDDPENQDTGDVDEVCGRRHQVRVPLAMSDSRRWTSPCTFVSRRPTDSRYPNSATHTNA